MNTEAHVGSCLCGDVRWQFESPLREMLHCHCSMCRKTHGAAFASFVTVASAQFEWLHGAEKIARYASSAHGTREFCPRCGSVVPDDGCAVVVIPIGATDDTLNVAERCHVFAASKAPWYTITDALPQYEQLPPHHGSETVDAPSPSTAHTGAVGGRCLCGDVAYEFDPPILRFVHCHCSRCRKSRAAAHSTQVFVAAAQFRWLSGEDAVSTFKPPDAQYFEPAFCARCGSLVPRFVPSAFAIIPAGTLDDDPLARPELHIFTASKAAWFTIADDLPQHADAPPRGWLSP